MVINFIKDKIESISDEEVCTDEDIDDSEVDKVIGFRQNVRGWKQNILVVRHGAL